MWSGGLDSTWTLSQFPDPVDVLSVNMVLRGEIDQKRADLEREARENIKPSFPQHRYQEISVKSDFNYYYGDCVQVAWWAAQHAFSLGLISGSRVLYGGNSDDDIAGKNPEKVKRQTTKIEQIFDLVYNGSGCGVPQYTWLKPEPSRAQQIEDLGSIADLTWSCRQPDDGGNECEECIPCRHISYAKTGIKTLR